MRWPNSLSCATASTATGTTPFDPVDRSSAGRSDHVISSQALRPDPSNRNVWGYGTQHNPTVSKIGDQCALVYIASGKMRGFGIGMMVAEDINGPWKKVGLVLSSSDDPNVWSYAVPPKGVSNPAAIHNPHNGKHYIYYKTRMGENRMSYFGVAVADKLEGPYIHHPKKIINNPNYIEDP